MSNKFFTKILLAFGLLACAATAAYAVRAYPYPITVTQPDGTRLIKHTPQILATPGHRIHRETCDLIFIKSFRIQK